MERRARYTLIGAFTLTSLLAAFAFVYWIHVVGGFGAKATYRVRFDGPVSGLTIGSNVLFNGIHAGAVSEIELDPNNPRAVVATIAIDPRIPMRSDTKVSITFLGFTGAPALSLKGGSEEAPPLTAENGQPPLLVAEKGTGLTLTETAEETLHHLDAILDQNAKPLHTAITGIATFADMLGRNSTRVENLLGGLEGLTGTGPTKKGPTIYDLAAATAFPPIEKSMKGQLVVPDPNALILFDSQKILTRNASGTYGNIDNAQWADNLPKLLQARILQSFENAHQISTVSRPIDQLSAQLRLELGIRSFQIALDPGPHAVVDLTARLVNAKGEIANARIFSASIAAKSMGAADAVAALDQAFSQVAREIVLWTAQSS